MFFHKGFLQLNACLLWDRTVTASDEIKVDDSKIMQTMKYFCLIFSLSLNVTQILFPQTKTIPKKCRKTSQTTTAY